MTLLPLYIDPGTGSMLFSIIVGAAAAVYFMLRALILKAGVFFAGGKKAAGAKHGFVIYAEDKRYWHLFKPVVGEFEKRGIPLLYLTSSKDDPVFDAELRNVKAEFIGEGNKAFARLNFLEADFVLATTPGLDVYQWKRSKGVKHYAHIVHSADEPIKYEMFGLDYYDSVLVTGSGFQADDIRKIEEKRGIAAKKIITAGCPYLDVLHERLKDVPQEENRAFTVLVSPSWGKSALLSKYGEKLLDPLLKTPWRIIVRPHPQSLIVEKGMIERLQSKYKDNSNLVWDFERENIVSISRADVMISDFSGIVLDYMFLRGKPVIYVAQKMDLRPYDAHTIYEKQDDMWTFRTLKKAGIELQPEMFDNLEERIKAAASDTSLESAIEEVKAEAWSYEGEAGRRVADFMVAETKEA